MESKSMDADKNFKITVEVLNPECMVDGAAEKTEYFCKGYLAILNMADGITSLMHGRTHKRGFAHGVIGLMDRINALPNLLFELITHMAIENLNSNNDNFMNEMCLSVLADILANSNKNTNTGE
jgi:hypothetical protein